MSEESKQAPDPEKPPRFRSVHQLYAYVEAEARQRVQQLIKERERTERS